MAKRYLVRLSEAERTEWEAWVKTGRAAARKRLHAQILLKADEGEHGPGWTDTAIMKAVNYQRNGATHYQRNGATYWVLQKDAQTSLRFYQFSLGSQFRSGFRDRVGLVGQGFRGAITLPF